MVIEQYTITNKYNFPQPTTDTILPQRFLEQSLYSLKQVQHQPFQLNTQNLQQFSITEQYPSSIQLKPQPIPIKPDHQETLIAAVDTSTIKIGETSTGIIVAIRGAITWRQNHCYKYTRLGPFIFHITEENKNAALQHSGTRLFQHQLRSQPPSRTKHNADANAASQPAGEVAANDACQNREPRRNPF